MKTDIQIAQEAVMSPITEIAAETGIPEKALDSYGKYKAKVDHRLVKELSDRENGKLILVTAITPTPAGEGKTTISVGLADALHQKGKRTMLTLREPSLGPVFGIKGGAAGGGYAQVVPMEDINLHFTGDLHAIGAANNLLAAMLDNHIHQGNSLHIDPRRIVWRRCVDMNDRQLRSVIDGLGGKASGIPRQDGFDITVASEVMAVFCLAETLSDLKKRLSSIVVGYTYSGDPVTVHDLGAEGAMTALLKDAFNPNLVQTLEHTPALIHGGPFANIAHGCNSVIATKLAMKLADYTVTEAGFGADLGAEKFLDIKCRKAKIAPSAIVLVATIRALKHHGGCAKEDFGKPNVEYLKIGSANLRRHIENLRDVYGIPVVVTINSFPTDSKEEIDYIFSLCKEMDVPCTLSDVFSKGGAGALALADEVIHLAESEEKHKLFFAYDPKCPSIKEKIEAVCRKIYHAAGVTYSDEALRDIKDIEAQNLPDLAVCIAKTQYSFSDNASRLAAPEGFTMAVRNVRLSAGAGFAVPVMGPIMTMPGLPKKPAALNIDVDDNGMITGLF